MKYYFIIADRRLKEYHDFINQIEAIGFVSQKKETNISDFLESSIWAMEFDNQTTHDPYKIYVSSCGSRGLRKEIAIAKKIEIYNGQNIEVSRNRNDLCLKNTHHEIKISSFIRFISEEQYQELHIEHTRKKTDMPPFLQALGRALAKKDNIPMQDKKDRVLITKEIFQWVEKEQARIWKSYYDRYKPWRETLKENRKKYKEYSYEYYCACQITLLQFNKDYPTDSLYIRNILSEMYQFLIDFYENKITSDEDIEKYYILSEKTKESDYLKAKYKDYERWKDDYEDLYGNEHWILQIINRHLFDPYHYGIAEHLDYNIVLILPSDKEKKNSPYIPIELYGDKYSVSRYTASKPQRPWLYFFDYNNFSTHHMNASGGYNLVSSYTMNHLIQQDIWRTGYDLRLGDINGIANDVGIYYDNKEKKEGLTYNIKNTQNQIIYSCLDDPKYAEHAELIEKIKLAIDLEESKDQDKALAEIKGEFLTILRKEGHTRDENVIRQFESDSNEQPKKIIKRIYALLPDSDDIDDISEQSENLGIQNKIEDTLEKSLDLKDTTICQKGNIMKYYFIIYNNVVSHMSNTENEIFTTFIQQIENIGFIKQETNTISSEAISLWSKELDNTPYNIYIRFKKTDKKFEYTDFNIKKLSIADKIFICHKHNTNVTQDIEVPDYFKMVNEEQYQALVKKDTYDKKTDMPFALQALSRAVAKKTGIDEKQGRVLLTKEIFQWIEKAQMQIEELGLTFLVECGKFSANNPFTLVWASTLSKIKDKYHKQHIYNSTDYYRACLKALLDLTDNNTNSNHKERLSFIYEFLIDSFNKEKFSDVMIESFYKVPEENKKPDHWIYNIIRKKFHSAINENEINPYKIAEYLGYNIVLISSTINYSIYDMPINLYDMRYYVTYCSAQTAKKPWIYFFDDKKN